MSSLPLILGVGQGSVAGKEVASRRSPSSSDRDKVMKRDNHTCRFCGFRSLQFQRLVPAAGETPPWATVCIFCEQAQTLERVGGTGSGILIWLPEMAQTDLHHLVRAIYVARASGGPMAEAATRALDALMTRRAEAKKRLGSDDPLLLATVLHENLNADEAAASAAKLEGIRFLPLEKYIVRTPKGDVNQLPAILNFWRSPQGPYAHLPVDGWAELFAKAA